MTASPPQEATHFRGKTLTPESPLPVHVPEPQNIPVLMNQIDPSFNDMSTHMEQRYPPPASNAMTSETLQQPAMTLLQDMMTSNQPGANETDKDNQASIAETLDAQMDASEPMSGLESEDIEQQKEHEIPQDFSITNALATMANGSYDFSLSTSTSNAPAPLTPNQGAESSADNVQEVPAPSENLQDTAASPVANADSTAPQPAPDSDAKSQASESDANGEGVNYQALLDNLSPSTSTAPAAENITISTTAAPRASSSPSSAQTPIATIPVPAGLPPRPPPQEIPAIHHNYTPGEDIRTYHNPPAQGSTTQASYNAQPNNPQQTPRGYVQSGGVAPNGMPPPPIATFQQPLSTPNQTQPSPQEPQQKQKDAPQLSKTAQVKAIHRDGEDEYPRRPEVEAIYEQFLKEEAIYVSEGTWDRFPPGSRLFVGNLFTEQVTKRDIFYVFHKYGRLAQISMKSAYGFVQYHDAHACSRALHSEQGIEIRGRKINLEISKPQKNTRNAAASAQGDSLRATYSRRSRSPDYTRGGTMYGGAQRGGADRYVGNAAPVAFERRGRDDYRPGMRSVSPPRGYRGREDFRPGGRSPDRYYRGRSRSPGYDRNGRYRSRSPRFLDPDDEANLPFARRHPRDVPDVQIILVDEVDRTFVGYIQQSFRDRGLACDVLRLPRVSLAAVVKRQVVEGVQAVVKIFHKSQNTGKIPLQVYNRSGGADNVRFDDYEDLDANVAAELVLRAKSTHLAPAPVPPQYAPAPQYGAPQYQQPHQPMQQPQPHQPLQQHQSHLPMQQQHQQAPQASGQNPNLANLITSLDGPALQKLLGAMQQSPHTPSNPQQHISPQQLGQTQDLSSLIQSVSQHQQVPSQQRPPPQTQTGYRFDPQYNSATPQQQQPLQHAYAAPVATPAYGSNPAAAGAYGARPPQQQGYSGAPQQQQGQPDNVQAMLAQLARYKQ